MLVKIEAATVEFERLGGRGVLVPGGFVLTAAHCVGWTATGDMALSGDDHREVVLTADGRKLWLAVYAIEPCADVAVLGAVDNQRSWKEAEDFEQFCERTEPVSLHEDRLEPFGEELPVLVFNKDRRWLNGSGQIYQPGQPTLALLTGEEIVGGASGGPVVTTTGELIAVISFTSTTAVFSREDGQKFAGRGARPLQSLPVWVVNKIQMATGEGLMGELRSGLALLDRQFGEAAGLKWSLRMSEQGRRGQLQSLAAAVLESSERNPGTGDAADYVRSCVRGPLGSVYAALADRIGDFDWCDEEVLQSEEYAIGFIQGVMNSFKL